MQAKFKAKQRPNTSSYTLEELIKGRERAHTRQRGDRPKKIKIGVEDANKELPHIFMSPIDNRTPKGIFKDIINAGKPLFAKTKLQAQRRASLPDSLSNTRALKQSSEAP